MPFERNNLHLLTFHNAVNSLQTYGVVGWSLAGISISAFPIVLT